MVMFNGELNNSFEYIYCPELLVIFFFEIHKEILLYNQQCAPFIEVTLWE